MPVPELFPSHGFGLQEKDALLSFEGQIMQFLNAPSELMGMFVQLNDRCFSLVRIRVETGDRFLPLAGG